MNTYWCKDFQENFEDDISQGLFIRDIDYAQLFSINARFRFIKHKGRSLVAGYTRECYAHLGGLNVVNKIYAARSRCSMNDEFIHYTSLFQLNIIYLCFLKLVILKIFLSKL